MLEKGLITLYKWSHRVVVILPLCHSGDTSSILVGTAKYMQDGEAVISYGS